MAVNALSKSHQSRPPFLTYRGGLRKTPPTSRPLRLFGGSTARARSTIDAFLPLSWSNLWLRHVTDAPVDGRLLEGPPARNRNDAFVASVDRPT